ncbi:MAG TPA: glycosyltransferase, partial [Magnetospirillum sp.]|nr:glycosyltransferase [Magnetospirillum sp.]
MRATAAHMHEGEGRLSRASRLMDNDTTPYGRRLAELTRALSDGALPLPPPCPEPAAADVAHAVMALHASPPHVNNGYTVRTLCLLDALRRAGVECAAVTRPNFPHDSAAFRGVPRTDADQAGGHVFHRLHAQAALWEGPLSAYVDAFAIGLADHARRSGAGVVHAASNHVCGLAACLAAEQVGVRSVYELRGLWHWSTINRRPGWQNSETFALHEALERQAALRAHRVVVLSDALAQHARGWGVDPARIVAVPNGVDADAFAPVPRDEAVRAAWGASPETFVAGFVGTFTPYEGLDTLLQAVARLRQRGVDAMAVLVGDGEEADRLKALAGKLGAKAAFPGRVPFAQVPKALAAMDCCPFPRRAEGATLLVPPLKLAEA